MSKQPHYTSIETPSEYGADYYFDDMWMAIIHDEDSNNISWTKLIDIYGIIFSFTDHFVREKRNAIDQVAKQDNTAIFNDENDDTFMITRESQHVQQAYQNYLAEKILLKSGGLW